MAEGKKKKWIKNAVKHPGAMTEAAKREGVSNSEYISEHKHDSGHSGQMARFADNVKGLKHKAKSKSEMAKKLYK
jgi:hypothetical protein